jgi:hypothetical protein
LTTVIFSNKREREVRRMKNQMDEFLKPKFTQFPSPSLFQYLGAFNFLPPNLRPVNFPRRERDVGRMKNQMDEIFYLSSPNFPPHPFFNA